MNFYYHPILGLQYDDVGEFFMIDLSCIPQDVEFDTQKWLEYFKEIRVQFFKPSTSPCCEKILKITSFNFRG